MMAGRVTEYAKKRFEEGDKNVQQYLAQVKAQISKDLAKKDGTAPVAQNLVNTKQSVSININKLFQTKCCILNQSILLELL